jgi:hypothetical protein
MFCRHCAHALESDAATCPSCGGKRHLPPADYPEAWPSAPGFAASGGPVLTSELLAYVGETGEREHDGIVHDYYLPVWAERLRTGTGMAKFNVAAAVFGLNWCLYRKMPLLGIGALVAEFGLAFIGAFIAVAILGAGAPTQPVGQAIPWVALATVRLAVGFLANRVYLDRALGRIATVRAQVPDPAARTTRLRAIGGTSTVLLAIGLVLSFATQASHLVQRLIAGAP